MNLCQDSGTASLSPIKQMAGRLRRFPVVRKFQDIFRSTNSINAANSSIKVLGVTISNNLSMAGHVSALLDTCARTLYGLRVLRAHGLHQDCLDEVFRYTVLAKLLYASPAWSGFCSAADNGKLDRFLNRCRKLYRCQAQQLNQDVSELFNLADQALFSSLQKNSHHVFHRLLPAKSTQPYNLRRRRHSFSLTQKQSSYDD